MSCLDHQRQRRILIVDDNRAIHDDFRKIFERAAGASELAELEADLFGDAPAGCDGPAYRIDDAFQGEDALQLVVEALQAGDPFDLAFVDMRMPPGWDGAETIERMWLEDSELQVVICTAYSDYSWCELFSRFGGRDNLLILQKPFDNSEVRQLAAAMTEKRRLSEKANLRTAELEQAVEQRTAELKAKDEHLRQKQKLEAIGSLAGGVAHEFNNLLQAITGYTKFAMEDLPSDSKARDDLQQVLESAERAATITNQLLGFSRRQPAQRTTFDLTELTSQSAAVLRTVLGEHIELHVSASDGATPIVADPGMIEQVLVNLCTNARDAMPSGGKLDISTAVVTLPDRRGRGNPHPDLPPGAYASLRVADTGCGMSEEVLQQAFNPFFTTKEVDKGTGLGLAMIHGIVEQHDGAIRIESMPAEGTTVEIYLPLTESEALAAPQDIESRARGGNETLLVAEDDPIVRDVSIRLLRKAGYTTLWAEDGEAAVRLLHDHGDDISLALLDVVMPKLSGHAVYQHLRQICPHVKVLFCTGYDPRASQVDFIREEEELALIEKPFASENLLRTVRELLDGPPASFLAEEGPVDGAPVELSCKL